MTLGEEARCEEEDVLCSQVLGVNGDGVSTVRVCEREGRETERVAE